MGSVGELKKFQSIEQYRHALQNLRKSRIEKAIFTGYVKIHGTNAGIVLREDGLLQTQSRNNILSVEKDVYNKNAGFESFVISDFDRIKNDMENMRDVIGCKELRVYGEWCGGNVQSSVALSNLDRKIFVIFDIVADGVHKDVEELNELDCIVFGNPSIYTIDLFGKYTVEVDVNYPELAQAEMIKLTDDVEALCPVGKYFGLEGVGEGIVYTHWVNGYPLRFKVKGEKHSASKVRTLAPVDPEKVKNAQEFVERLCNENRLKQGMDYLAEMNISSNEMSNVGHFIRWVITDVLKEEFDTMQTSGLEEKMVKPLISKKAKLFYEKQLH